MRRLVGFLLVAMLGLAACGGGSSKNSSPTTTSSGAASSTSAAPSGGASSTTLNTAPLVPAGSRTLSLPCQQIPPPVTPVTSPSQSASVLLVKVDEQGDRCVDHVVFSFTSKSPDPPGYVITYGTPPF